MDEYQSMDASLGRHALDLAQQEWGGLRSINSALSGLIAEPDRICTVEGKWYVVSIEHQHGDLARAEIAARGMVAYLPMMPQQERPRRGIARTVYRPMLGPYMFVRCMAYQWALVSAARGVQRFLRGADCTPESVGEGCIEVIRLIEAEEREIAEERARQDERIAKAKAKAEAGGRSGVVWHFAAGDRVRIKNGPFAGLYAILRAAPCVHDRIRAVMDIFGSESPVELSAFDIEKAV